MATAAAYDVIQDTAITPDLGVNHDLAINFIPGAILTVRSVLSYMVDPGPFGVTFTMSILSGIDTVVVPATVLPAQSGHVRQEVIGANVLTSPDTLRILVTAGSATFSDIVLMHYV